MPKRSVTIVTAVLVAAALSVYLVAGSMANRAEPAGFEEIRRFYEHLEAAITQSGFLDPAHPKRLMPRLRRLFDRVGLEKDEVSLLRGMLKTFMKKPGDKVD